MRKSNFFRFLVILAILLSLTFFLSANSQYMDVVVLLDTSESMFPYFENTVQYVIDTILKEYLQKEDQFHLISFNSQTQLEITRKILGPKDLEDILARTMLLQPFGKHTDLVFALKYLQKYVSDLPPQSKKTILILTDGIHDPPAGSNFPSDTTEQSEDNKQQVAEIAESMRREGWEVNLFRIPAQSENEQQKIASSESTGIGESGKTDQKLDATEDQQITDRHEESTKNAEESSEDMYSVLSDKMDIPVREYDTKSTTDNGKRAIGMPTIDFPIELGTVHRKTHIPFSITNFSDNPILVKIEGILYDGVNIINEESSKRIPDNQTDILSASVTLPKTPPGEHSISIQIIFGDNLRISPAQGSLHYTLKAGGAYPVWKIILFIALILIAILTIVLFIRFIVSRKRYKKSSTDTESDILQSRSLRSQNTEQSTTLRDHQRYSSTDSAFQPNSSTDTTFVGSPNDRRSVAPTLTRSADTDSNMTVGSSTKEKKRNERAFAISDSDSNTLRGDSLTKIQDEESAPSQQELDAEPTQSQQEKHASDDDNAQVAKPKTIGLDKGETLPKLRKSKPAGNKPIEMIVIGQNHLIGQRNIHLIETGQKFIVGGKKRSHFRIFLLPLPPKIAEITRLQDNSLQFIPLDTTLFPDFSEPVPNCLDTYLRIVIDNKELYFYFREWESPLEKLNRLMHIVDKPGRPDFPY